MNDTDNTDIRNNTLDTIADAILTNNTGLIERMKAFSAKIAAEYLIVPKTNDTITNGTIAINNTRLVESLKALSARGLPRTGSQG